MSRPSSSKGALGRRVARLVPAEQREWVEAIWAEAPQVPAGWSRFVWRLGAVRLIARSAAFRRTMATTVLFALGAASAMWAAWPTSGNLDAPIDRLGVIVIVAIAAVPALSRPILGPVADSRAARYLRYGVCFALLARIPGLTVMDHFASTVPAGAVDRHLYRVMNLNPQSGTPWAGDVWLLAVLGLYALAIAWMTSRRSRVTTTTLTIGIRVGVGLGLVTYVVAPLGLDRDATNPWLQGTSSDPLVVAAWLLLLFGSTAAVAIAHRRYMASFTTPPPPRDQARQVLAAGALPGLLGALIPNLLGTGTIAAMLKAAWLRNWLYHGQTLLFGVRWLAADLKGGPAIAYGHELVAVNNAAALGVMLVAFPVIALIIPLFAAAVLAFGSLETGERPASGGGGGEPRPPAPPPDDGEPSVTDGGSGPAVRIEPLPPPLGVPPLGRELALAQGAD